MTRLTESERLVAVETNLHNLTQTAQQGFADTKEGFMAINARLDQVLPTYVTQSEFTQYKSSQNIQKILLSILMIIVGALVGFFIAHIGG